MLPQVISQSGKKNVVFGKYGKEEGEFDGPHSVAVDKADNIYIADLYNQRIQVRVMRSFDHDSLCSLSVQEQWMFNFTNVNN